MSLNTIVWKRIQRAFDEVPSSKGMSYRDHALENLRKALFLFWFSSGVAVHALFPMVCASCESRICRLIGAKIPASAPWDGPKSQAENTLAAEKAEETCADAVPECQATLENPAESDGSDGVDDVFEPEHAGKSDSVAFGDDSNEASTDANVSGGAGNIDAQDIEQPTEERVAPGFEEHKQDNQES